MPRKDSVGPRSEPSPEMQREVADARWLPLEDAGSLLAYKGEREMAEKALSTVREQAL